MITTNNIKLTIMANIKFILAVQDTNATRHTPTNNEITIIAESNIELIQGR